MKKLMIILSTVAIALVSCDKQVAKNENIEQIVDTLQTMMSEDIEMAKTFADSLLITGSPKVKAEANYALGVYFNLKDSSEIARSHFQNSLSWAMQNQDTAKMVACYRQLATLYRKSGLNVQSKQYFKTALTLAKSIKDTMEMAKLYIGLQKTDLDEGQLASAKVWHKEFLSLGIYGELAILNEFLQFNTHFEEGDYVKADSVLKNLENSYKEMSPRSKATMLENKALLAIKNGNLKQGVNLMHEQLNSEVEHSGSKTKSLIFQRMSQAFEDYHNVDSALYYYKKYHESENDLVKAENSSQFVRQQTIFEEQQKQANIQAEADRQKQIKKTILIISVICLLALMIISYLIYKNLRQKTKQNEVLSTLNSHISKQKQEIVESIEYAKTIQTGFLPSLEDIKNAFVFYSPKDIVSGDFYFYHEHAGKKYYAVGDCTGHGVPGAMLTMLAHNKLSETVEKDTLFENILSVLHSSVKKSLGQDRHSGRDGFDLALVCIEGNMMKCALANRPVYVVRNGVLQEIKPNKACIGGGEEEHVYETVTFQLEPNDAVYLFSDGVADQFGGDKGKKWMSKNFKESLLTVSKERSAESIKTIFENWKGSHSQTDDVTVVGIYPG
jgi:serine phosphatase RsbU (regulator of sigma subunit)